MSSADPSALQECLHALPDFSDDFVAIVEREPGGFNRFTKTNRDRDRVDHETALAHRAPCTKDGGGHDRRLRLERHDEATLLEWQQGASPAPRSLGKNEERIAFPKRCGG